MPTETTAAEGDDPMTPQERQLVAELFDRLATLEDERRDPDAERAIADELARAPHAPYALVQTVLVQDEALKRADTRIRDLEAAVDTPAPREGRFLDNMRSALFGERAQARGSVPSVQPDNAPMGVPPAFRTDAPPASPLGPMQDAGRGGSFLGTAAAAAAGVIGGSLLLDGIRSMFGHHPGALGQTAFDPGLSGETRSPSDAGAGGDLAREAGIDDIGRSHSAAYDDGDQRVGLLDDGDEVDGDTDDGGDLGGGDVDTA
jgi:hypothetical protein